MCVIYLNQPKSLNLAKLLKTFKANIKATCMLAKKKKKSASEMVKITG